MHSETVDTHRSSVAMASKVLEAARIRAVRWSRRPVRPGPPRRVLIQFPYRLGDFLLLTPALEALGRANGDVRFEIWVEPHQLSGIKALAQGNPWIVCVRSNQGLGHTISHGRGFDQLVRLGRASLLDDLVALLNPRGRVTGGDRPVLTTAEHISQVFFAAVVGRSPGTEDSLRPRLYRDSHEVWEGQPSPDGRIVLAVGGDDHNRCYGGWKAVADGLGVVNRPLSVIGRATDIADAGLSDLPGGQAPTADLRGLVAKVASASAVITTDTLFLHLCSALGVGGVALFGPTDPSLRIWDHGTGSMVGLCRPGSCDRLPCHNDMYDECRTGHVPCMDFAPQRVVATVLAGLDEADRGP